MTILGQFGQVELVDFAAFQEFYHEVSQPELIIALSQKLKEKGKVVEVVAVGEQVLARDEPFN